MWVVKGGSSWQLDTDPDTEETAGVERSQESPGEHQQGTRGSVMSEVGLEEGVIHLVRNSRKIK